MSPIGDTLARIARNVPVSQTELEELRLWGNQTQQNNAWLAGIQTPDQLINSLKINFPLSLIYHERLATNKTELNFQIPRDYNHLLFIGSGRTTGAGTANTALVAEFNGDNTNYTQQVLYGSNVTAAALISTGAFPVGNLTDGGHDAGKTSVFFCLVLDYSGTSLFKGAIVLWGDQSSTTQRVIGIDYNVWTVTSPITSVRLFPTTDSIAAGSIISVYGLR